MVKCFIGLEIGKSNIDGVNIIFRANISKGCNCPSSPIEKIINDFII